MNTCKSSNKEGIILHHSALSTDAAIKRTSSKGSSFLFEVTDISYPANDLSETVSAAGLSAQKSNTPQALLDFFYTLYTGSSNVSSTSDSVQRLIRSISNDVMFATTRGRIKPSKHISFGLGLKSSTGSRRVLEILNRFGHAISYHKAEELETQMASDSIDRSGATPDGLHQQVGLCTGLAWDSYDENTETLSGRGTLHDTVGICYQNKLLNNIENQTNAPDVPRDNDTVCSDGLTTLKVSKRTLHLKEKQLEPYRKKPKITVFQYQVETIPRPLNLTTVNYRDMLWMMTISLEKQTPMWCGWNALVTPDLLPKQSIGYMENLNLPPTRLDVIAETLKISQRVTDECGEKYAVVTYDLAVAKPAMQMQAVESPLYDHVLICFGAFHIVLAFFGVSGHIVFCLC